MPLMPLVLTPRYISCSLITKIHKSSLNLPNPEHSYVDVSNRKVSLYKPHAAFSIDWIYQSKQHIVIQKTEEWSNLTKELSLFSLEICLYGPLPEDRLCSMQSLQQGWDLISNQIDSLILSHQESTLKAATGRTMSTCLYYQTSANPRTTIN